MHELHCTQPSPRVDYNLFLCNSTDLFQTAVGTTGSRLLFSQYFALMEKGNKTRVSQYTRKVPQVSLPEPYKNKLKRFQHSVFKSISPLALQSWFELVDFCTSLREVKFVSPWVFVVRNPESTEFSKLGLIQQKVRNLNQSTEENPRASFETLGKVQCSQNTGIPTEPVVRAHHVRFLQTMSAFAAHLW